MRAHMASDANVGENPFSGRGQNRAMIAERSREIKAHATSQPRRWPSPPAGGTAHRSDAPAQNVSQSAMRPHNKTASEHRLDIQAAFVLVKCRHIRNEGAVSGPTSVERVRRG